MDTRTIRIWLHDDVPAPLARIIPGFDDTHQPMGACVCHVPQAMIDSEDYQLCESLPPLQLARNVISDERLKWMPMNGNYLFGTNACDVIEHPQGDGLIYVFSNI